MTRIGNRTPSFKNLRRESCPHYTSFNVGTFQLHSGSKLIMVDQNHIVIRGARQHNLKNITLKIPRNQLVVITGLSGSGKSSLAFDTIYAEGQRRYVESL